MINDLKEKASTSMRQLEASQKEKDEIEERANNYFIEIEDLKREVEKIKAAYAEKVDELNSANEDLKMIENNQQNSREQSRNIQEDGKSHMTDAILFF